MSTVPRPWNYEQRVEFLKHEKKRGTHRWEGKCAWLAAMSAGFQTQGFNDASTWGRHVRSTGALRKNGREGDFAWWITNGFGHVANVIDSGLVFCNMADGSVGRVKLSYYAGLGTPLFASGDDRRIWQWAAGTNEIWQPPTPAAAPVKWPMVPGHNYQRAVVLKRALGFRANSTKHYGKPITARVKAWQAANGYKPDGLVTAAQFHAITHAAK